MKRLIVANWKMNFTLKDSLVFCIAIQKDLEDRENIIIAPQAPYLALLEKEFPSLKFAAQDVSRFKQGGAYTGEYNAGALKSCGIGHAIIGHSERFSFAGERDDYIRDKIQNCLDIFVTPIICVGESAEDRKNGNYLKSLKNKIEKILPPEEEREIIIAYEPIWSVGTDTLPSVGELREIFSLLSELAPKARTLYGGSVNLGNIEKILEIKEITGILLGRSSLDYDDFIEITRLVSRP